MRRTPIIRIRSMNLSPLRPRMIRHAWDTDWDGVPNDLDREWYDPNKY